MAKTSWRAMGGATALCAALTAPLGIAAPAGSAVSAAPVADGRRHHHAVVDLLNDAARRVEQRDFAAASAALERALRIDPTDGEIWHLLGQIRLQQGKTDQVRALTAKSNALSRDDARLRQRNAELLALAERRRAADGGGDAAAPTVTTATTASTATTRPEPTGNDARRAAPPAVVTTTREPTSRPRQSLQRSKRALALALADFDDQRQRGGFLSGRARDDARTRELEQLVGQLRARARERRPARR